MSLRFIVLPLVIVASVDASYLMESTGVVASSHQRGPGTLLSAKEEDYWFATGTELIMDKDGRAELKNLSPFRMSATVGHVLHGTWSPTGPDHFLVTFHRDNYITEHRTNTKISATLRAAVIDGSKVQLSGLQGIKLHLHHELLSLNIDNRNGEPVPEPTSTPKPTPESTSAYACTQRYNKIKLHRGDKCSCHASALSCGLCGGAYRKGVRPPVHCSH